MMQSTWITVIALTLLCVYYGIEVAANHCYLGQEPDSNQEGKLRWVLPVDYNNRCICTSLLPGGLNLYTPERSYIPYYIDQPPFRATERDLVTFLDCPVDFSIIGKPTEQSSTYRFQYSSDKAVDGKGVTATQNGDCTHTTVDGEIDPWWRVDLEGDHCIRTITIINRIFCCSERLTGAVARAGLDPIVTNNTICGEPVTAEQAAPRGGIIEFKCDPPVRARYVFVDIPRDTPAKLHLCEVMVKEFPLEICSP
ncbi:fucolectin-like [Asterias rubens]|uniref:fucolectin-like n=1 Tax=Asterias rubens TaxID=7604 RepID=UPI0014552BDB|nr:fucolectin-like [Asterias rubens]